MRLKTAVPLAKGIEPMLEEGPGRVAVKSTRADTVKVAAGLRPSG